MSRKHFSLLLVITVVVLVLVLLVPGKTSRKSDVERSLLLPGLQEQVNDVEWLRIVGPGAETIATLSRGEGYWRVEEVYGYRANWEQVKTLLGDLARAEIVEQKTDNPEYYGRLGVADISQPDATGVMIEFAESSGLPGLVVGNRLQGRDGHYVRLQGEAESVLIDRSLEVPSDRRGWLDQSIIHIADSEVVEIEIIHPDGEHISARKTSADDEHFVLEGVPEGREIQSAWTVDSLAGGLASLTLEAVVPESDIDWTGATRYGLTTADGLRVDAELVAIEAAGEEEEADAEYWIRLGASLYQTAVESAVAPSEEGANAASERAESVNERVDGWAYRIPKYKFDAMTKRMQDLLKAPDSAEG